MQIRPADRSDFDDVTDLLSELGIPPADLTPSDMNRFLVCQRAEEGWFDRLAILRTVALLPKHRLPDRSSAICGVVGLEVRGRVALVHSLGLSPETEDDGGRARLLSELERRAKEQGIERLYVRTKAEPGFFQAQGYQIVSPREIPEGHRIREGRDQIRPPRATPMRKRIGGSGREVVAA